MLSAVANPARCLSYHGADDKFPVIVCVLYRVALATPIAHQPRNHESVRESPGLQICACILSHGYKNFSIDLSISELVRGHAIAVKNRSLNPVICIIVEDEYRRFFSKCMIHL